MTNLSHMPAGDLLGHSAVLCLVGWNFRVNRRDIYVRPILRWAERRIGAYLAIAFMTPPCVRHVAWRTQLQQRRALSEDAIRWALTGVQCSLLYDSRSGRGYVLPSAVSDVARRPYRVMWLTRTDVPFELTESARQHRF